jgi:hypothetical protein
MGTSPDQGAAARRWRDRVSAALRPRTNGAAPRTPADATSVLAEAPAARPGSAGPDVVAASLDDILREIAENRAAQPDTGGDDGPG